MRLLIFTRSWSYSCKLLPLLFNPKHAHMSSHNRKQTRMTVFEGIRHKLLTLRHLKARLSLMKNTSQSLIIHNKCNINHYMHTREYMIGRKCWKVHLEKKKKKKKKKIYEISPSKTYLIRSMLPPWGPMIEWALDPGWSFPHSFRGR